MSGEFRGVPITTLANDMLYVGTMDSQEFRHGISTTDYPGPDLLISQISVCLPDHRVRRLVTIYLPVTIYHIASPETLWSCRACVNCPSASNGTGKGWGESRCHGSICLSVTVSAPAFGDTLFEPGCND